MRKPDEKEWKCSKILRIEQNKFYRPYFPDQNWIPKTVYCIRCVMVCKIGFTNWNAITALLRASMVVTYYIKFFRTGTDRRNGILMYLLLLVVEKIIFLLSNPLKFSKISYLTSLAKASSAEFRVYLSSLALLVELIYKVIDDYHYHNHSNHYHHQHCRYRNQ